MEKSDPIPVKYSMAFYDKAEDVLSRKRKVVSIRGEKDKYERFQPGDRFTVDIPDEGIETEGLVLGHWKVQFNEIQPEFLAGEGYLVPFGSSREEIVSILEKRAVEDLSQYYDLESTNFFRIIVYVTKEDTDLELFEQYAQLENESPEEWLDRCGDQVFGEIKGYRVLSEQL